MSRLSPLLAHLLLLAALMISHGAYGQEPVPTNTSLPAFGPLLVQVSVSLLLVCVLAWLVIRFGLARLRPPTSPEARLELLDTLPIGARRSVVLLRAHDRVLVVGITETGMSLLSDLGPGSAQQFRPQGDGGFEAALNHAQPPSSPDDAPPDEPSSD